MPAAIWTNILDFPFQWSLGYAYFLFHNQISSVAQMTWQILWTNVWIIHAKLNAYNLVTKGMNKTKKYWNIDKTKGMKNDAFHTITSSWFVFVFIVFDYSCIYFIHLFMWRLT